MSVRAKVTKDDPVIGYSMCRYGTIRMSFGDPGASKVMPPKWRCDRILIWNEGKNGIIRKTSHTDRAEFQTKAEAEAWIAAVIERHGDDVRWKEPDPERPQYFYGYAGNWTLQQANGEE